MSIALLRSTWKLPLALVLPAMLSLAFDRVAAAEPDNSSHAQAAVSFQRDIAPIVATRCVACHGPKSPESDYQLHTFARLTKGGASGEPPIVAGKPDASYLFELVTSPDADLRMPKEGKPLTEGEIDRLRRWIAEGAAFDGPDVEAPIESYLPKAAQPLPPEVYPRPVPVTAMAFSPDGSLLATGGYHEVLVWSVANTGGTASNDAVPFHGAPKLVKRISNVAERIHAIAYRADGALLAVAAGTPGRAGEVKLFQPETGQLVAELASAPDELFDVEFSPDGARLAACGGDRTVRIFDVASHRELRRIEAHADWVMAIAWSPDGTKLASASRDKTAKILDANTGEVLVTYPGHEEQVFDLIFATDGQQVYSAGRGRELHRWSTDGKSTSKSDVRTKQTGPIFGRTRGEIYRLALLEGRVLAVSADGRSSVFDPGQKDARNPSFVYEGAPPQTYALAIDRQAKRIAAGGFDGRVAIYAVGDASPWRVFVAAPGFD
jgi:hypothetical protein